MADKKVLAYSNGYNSCKYHFTYLDPYYTDEELSAWVEGYKEAKEQQLEESQEYLDNLLD